MTTALKRVVVYFHRFLSLSFVTVSDPLPPGKTQLVVDFAYDGGGMGKGGKITMSANGKKIAEGRLERTIPIQFSLGEGVDIGRDVGSPIDFTYKLPFEFTGKIEKVAVDLKTAAAGALSPRRQKRRLLRNEARRPLSRYAPRLQDLLRTLQVNYSGLVK